MLFSKIANASWSQSSYLSQISQITFVEKNCQEILEKLEKFCENVGTFEKKIEKCWEILGDFATIYALSCGEKLSPKSTFVEKNDKYEVYLIYLPTSSTICKFTLNAEKSHQ